MDDGAVAEVRPRGIKRDTLARRLVLDDLGSLKKLLDLFFGQQRVVPLCTERERKYDESKNNKNGDGLTPRGRGKPCMGVSSGNYPTLLCPVCAHGDNTNRGNGEVMVYDLNTSSH